ncbi:MAG: GNAT family N-acetyltransferase [Patescibacteria group bacterium]|nr:GNAT family N-acetyltransferase [Patescibacteria group bacterium]
MLPFIRTRKFGVKVLANISSKYKFLDRSALLFRTNDTTLAQDILNEIGSGHNLYLAEIEEKYIQLFRELKQKPLIEFSTYCPRMVIPEDDILRKVSKKQRNSLKQRLRKNSDKLSFTMYRDDLENHLRTMIKIENESHKRNKKISIFSRRDIRNLYRSIIQNAPEMVGIAFLYYDGAPIAHRFGYFCHDVFLSVHIAFDNAFRHLGPGKMLLYYCLEYFQDNNVRLLDFSVGDNDLKRQFADGRVTQYNVYYSRSGLVMKWWSLLLKTKKKAKHIRNIIQTR